MKVATLLFLLAAIATLEGCSKPDYAPPTDQIPSIPAGRASIDAENKGGLVAPP